jgi:hypothetical protein
MLDTKFQRKLTNLTRARFCIYKVIQKREKALIDLPTCKLKKYIY